MHKNLYAHSANGQGERQLLVDHLRNVAKIARDLADPFGGGDIAFLAGLWHDVGKADPKWQERLIECEKGDQGRRGLNPPCPDRTGHNLSVVEELRGRGCSLPSERARTETRANQIG